MDKVNSLHNTKVKGQLIIEIAKISILIERNNVSNYIKKWKFVIKVLEENIINN